MSNRQVLKFTPLGAKLVKEQSKNQINAHKNSTHENYQFFGINGKHFT